MARERIRHMFPGGNTPQGFFSYYEYVVPNTATRIFLLKGGPVVGKSAFMKEIGQVMLAHGCLIEYHHCCSDPTCLDGLVIPALNIALIDGTAPPIVAPCYPGCVDEILNLGEYWNEGELVKNKAALSSLSTKISHSFQRAYRMLKAAKVFYDDWEAANYEAMNFARANEKTAAIIARIFNGITSVGHGKNRKLFASAITPLGPVNYIDSICSGISSRYILAGLPGTGKATLLSTVAAAAVAKGLDVETYYCPLDPQKMEHIIIPSLDTALLTSASPHNLPANRATTAIDMNECLDQIIIDKLATVIDYDRTAFWEFFSKAGTYIKEAKKLHDELETYYIPAVNFNGIDELREKVLAKLLNLSENCSNQSI